MVSRATGRPLRAWVEDGLRLVLEENAKKVSYRLPDRRVGNTNDPIPPDGLNWQDLRDAIYGTDTT